MPQFIVRSLPDTRNRQILSIPIMTTLPIVAQITVENVPQLDLTSSKLMERLRELAAYYCHLHHDVRRPSGTVLKPSSQPL